MEGICFYPPKHVNKISSLCYIRFVYSSFLVIFRRKMVVSLFDGEDECFICHNQSAKKTL